MTCREFSDLIVTSVKHDRDFCAMTRAERRALTTHLESCPNCLKACASIALSIMAENPQEAVADLHAGQAQRDRDIAAHDAEARW